MNEIQEVFTPLLNRLLSEGVLWQMSLKIIKVLLILIAGKLLLRFFSFLIDNFFQEKSSRSRHVNQRNKTLKTVAKSAIQYLFYFIGVTIILDLFGIPTASILAGAGVIGLALGFGAQSLVKDIITGFFILFEDQFTVGDYIKTADIDGIVEEVGLRVTKIKNFDGDLHIVPNGNITQVTNLSAAHKRAVIDAPIDYDQNIEEAAAVLEEVCAEIKEEHSDVIKEGPQVLGVQELAGSSVNIRITAMVKPMEVWRISRVIRQRIKEKLDQAGIDIPYDHLTVVEKGNN